MKTLKKTALVVCMMLIAGIVFAGSAKVKADTDKADRIADGVFIGNVAVGGMSSEEARQAFEDYLSSLNQESFTLCGYDGKTVTMSAEELGLSADLDLAITRAEAVGKTGNLINRFKQTEDLKTTSVVIDPSLQINKQQTANYIYRNRHELSLEAVNMGLVPDNGGFTIVDGKKGEEVDCVQSVYVIQEFIKNWNVGDANEISLVINEVMPKGSREELEQVKDIIGTFSTSIPSFSDGRGKNVKTGCECINGTILYPGDEFSADAAMRPYTEENGYALAGSYLNGQVVESLGGGICQVSSTLYNAAIRAELEIVERFNHSMTVGYVDLSADAAIAGDYKDLKLKNNTDTPIYIEAVCGSGKITFNIYGKETRPANRKISFVSETLETKEPAINYNVTADQPVGYYHVDSSGHTGYRARLWKVVTVDGVEQSREIFNNSSYISSPKTVTVGIGGTTPEQAASIQAVVAGKNDADIQTTIGTVAAEVANTAAQQNPEGQQTEGQQPSAGQQPTGQQSSGTEEKPASGQQSSEGQQSSGNNSKPEENNSQNNQTEENGNSENAETKPADGASSNENPDAAQN